MQEGARRFRISGGAAAVTLGTFEPIDISRETNGDVMLLVTLKMTDAPERAPVSQCAAGPLTSDHHGGRFRRAANSSAMGSRSSACATRAST